MSTHLSEQYSKHHNDYQMQETPSFSVLPDHLFPLKDKQWALWRDVAVRGAGFPVHLVLELAVTECAKAADELLCAEERVEEARAKALEVLRNRMNQVDETEHRSLVKISRAIKNLQVPQPLKPFNVNCEEVEAFSISYSQWCTQYEALQKIFDASNLQVSNVISRVAGDKRFREAVVWQNRQALRTALDLLLKETSENAQQNSKHRLHEAMAANYLSRYCTKNDSVGFFGPIGWANIVSNGEAITVQPGPDLLATRKVYFEAWGLDRLAEYISQDKAVLHWMPPRLMPQTYVNGSTLSIPFSKPIKLTSHQAQVLSLCDGKLMAREIADQLIHNPGSGLKSEQEVYTILEQFSTAKRILWALELPPEGIFPEQILREMLEHIGDERLRNEKLALLDQLLQARECVIQATGDAEMLDKALGEINNVFMNITNDEVATRGEGKVYAARTLLYEDCRRDCEINLGPEFVSRLEQPLTLLLKSARWLTYTLAGFYYSLFFDAYAELAERAGNSTVEFAEFWLWMQAEIFDDESRFSTTLINMFQERWAEILPFSEDERRVYFNSEDLETHVHTAFDAPRPGWNGGRYHCPDVLIRATSPEAIQRGDYQLVLGEVHSGMNSLQAALFPAQHPDPERLINYVAIDIPEPRILPVLPKYIFPPSSRVRPAFISPKDIRLLFSADAGVPPHQQTMPVSSFVVDQVDGVLAVRSRDGQWCFDFIEVFGEFMMRRVYDCFKLFPASKHRPRVTIDQVVIARETWCFAPAEVEFAFEKDPLQRFIAARRWARAHNMPRFMFLKVPSEKKPCFLDFDSPINLNAFAKMVRYNQEIQSPDGSIVLSEMLPEPDQSWLIDADGSHYTSELRIVALDLLTPYDE